MFEKKISDHLKLRMTTIEDAEPLFNLIQKNKNYLVKWLPWISEITTLELEKDFIKESLRRMLQGITWLATILVDNQVVGMVDIHSIDRENFHGELGYWIGKDYQGQGLMSKVVEAVVKIAFSDLKLHRLSIIVAASNIGSQKVAINNKFIKESALKDYLYINDKFKDAILYTRIFN